MAESSNVCGGRSAVFSGYRRFQLGWEPDLAVAPYPLAYLFCWAMAMANWNSAAVEARDFFARVLQQADAFFSAPTLGRAAHLPL